MKHNKMEKFDFLIGSWALESHVPKSTFSEEDYGSGSGIFKRTLDDQYVSFDYHATLTTGKGAAHGIFAWDEKAGIYRYWWFEDSGSFLTATCNFINQNTLFMNWHDTLLIQTFTKIKKNKVILSMENPDSDGIYQPILKVILTKK
jgi:hypothetical protein